MDLTEAEAKKKILELLKQEFPHFPNIREITEIIIKYPKVVEAKDNEDNTPLLLVAYNGLAKELAELLIASGADMNARNICGLTPFLAAEQKLFFSPHSLEGKRWMCSELSVNVDDIQTPSDVFNSNREQIKELLMEKGANVDIKPNYGRTQQFWFTFSLSALERIAEIVANRYTGYQITQFFKKAGFPQIQHDDSAKCKFVYNALHILHSQPFGTDIITIIIETLCDPQEYFGKPDSHKGMLKQINEILAFYKLQVNDEGKIVATPSISPTLLSQCSEAEKLFEQRKFHAEIQKHARSLFLEGNHYHAVLECCKTFEKYIKEKTGMSESKLVGCALMENTLGKSGSLKVNSQKTQIEIDEQLGVMYLCKGLVETTKNLESHEPMLDWPISQEDALDILSLLNFLWRKIDSAKVIGTCQ